MTPSNFNTTALQLPYLQNKEHKPEKHKKKWMMTFAFAKYIQCKFDFFSTQHHKCVLKPQCSKHYVFIGGVSFAFNLPSMAG